MDCRDAMPRNEAMAQGLDWQQVNIGPMPGAYVEDQATAAPMLREVGQSDFVEQLLEQARLGKQQMVEALARERLGSVDAREWLMRGEQRLNEKLENAVPLLEPAPLQPEAQR